MFCPFSCFTFLQSLTIAYEVFTMCSLPWLFFMQIKFYRFTTQKWFGSIGLIDSCHSILKIFNAYCVFFILFSFSVGPNDAFDSSGLELCVIINTWRSLSGSEILIHSVLAMSVIQHKGSRVRNGLCTQTFLSDGTASRNPPSPESFHRASYRHLKKRVKYEWYPRGGCVNDGVVWRWRRWVAVTEGCVCVCIYVFSAHTHM